MTFALSGNLIAQYGTDDTNLAGLAGIAGVSRFTAGDQNVYNLANLDLTIAGTLTINPETECLFFGTGGRRDGRLTVSGTLTVGQEINVGAVANRFSSGVWARFTRANDSQFLETESDLKITGTANFYGGTLITKRVIALMEGSTARTYSRQVIWISQHTAVVNIRQRSANTAINGLVTRGFVYAPIAQPAQWDGWQPYDVPGQEGINPSSSSPLNTWLIIRDFDPSGLVGQQACFWFSVWLRLVDGVRGSGVNVQGNEDDSPFNLGLYEIRQGVRLRVEDANGGAIAGCKIFTSDTNHGNRLGANQVGTNPSYTATRTYASTTDGVGAGAFTADGGILTAVIWRNTGGLRNANNRYDYRGLTNNDGDRFLFGFCSYLHQVSSRTLVLKGAGGTDYTQALLTDQAITEPDPVVVSNYGTVQNADQFYDRAKLWLVDNFAGQLAPLVTKTGSEIDVGNFNVVVDSSAPQAFSFDGSTITLKAATYTGLIRTTGTITLINGAVAGPLVIVRVRDASGAAISGARVYIPGVLNALTNPSGDAQTHYSGPIPQVVSGKVRKASTPPFYKAASVTGTITAVGLDLTVTLISD